MKKLIIAALVCGMVLSVGACNKSDSDAEVTTVATTVAVTDDPKNAAMVITLDDIQKVIDKAAKDYEEISEVKLVDGTVMKTEPKNPGITLEDVNSGVATYEQMSGYSMYLANLRRLVATRLVTDFPAGNTVILSTGSDKEAGDFLILDPVGAGYKNAALLFSEMLDTESEEGIDADYVYINNGVSALFDGKTEEITLLCPNDKENELLMAITAKLNPDLLTEKVTETEAVTE